MNTHVLFAVFKRNFVSYFSNPTGYMFICVFLLISSLGAFYPDEFFNANLATLDQLNFWLPVTMLIFIPAITMGIWAEERRQGTDELLLTIPAGDVDVVIGKYLASLAIFTASLLFSMISNFVVLSSLGSPDVGLFICIYIGYFAVGMAMLAIGMAASFLTSNLTLGFVFGALMNAPLVIVSYADKFIPWDDVVRMVKPAGLSANFADFGRGVLSLSSLTYFAAITVVMIYVSVVLIGRRHWLGGRDGHSLLGHYIVRAVLLAAIVAGLTFTFNHRDLVRLDLTSENLNSLSPDTEEILQALDSDVHIEIEAFISPDVPEMYVQTRLDLLAMLGEMEKNSGGKVKVRIYRTEPFSDVAQRAKDEYDISRKAVAYELRGTRVQRNIFLGVAIKKGLDKVVIPFFDLGTPVEYELIRSITAVNSTQRKKLGIVRTDADLLGGFGVSRQLIVDELEKQYEVVEVDPNEKIVDPADKKKDVYDALLLVQPSSLTPSQLPHVLDAIKSGVPTAIFEDPFPAWMQGVPGTSQPKRPPQNQFMAMMRRQPPQPKCDIKLLWDLLGVKMLGKSKGFGGTFGAPSFDALIVGQAYNPYPKLRQSQNITNQWVFVSNDAPGGGQCFHDDDEDNIISSGLRELLFLMPGAVSKKNSSTLGFQPLVTTGNKTSTIEFDQLRGTSRDSDELEHLEKSTDDVPYVLAARVTGKLDEKEIASLAKVQNSDDEEGPAHTPGNIDVVIVMDIDLLESTFIALRTRPMPELELHFQNVAFALNVIDALIGETRFLDIRKRHQGHRVLSKLEDRLNVIRAESDDNIEEYREKFKEETEKAEKLRKETLEELEEVVNKLRSDPNADPKKAEASILRLALKTQIEERRETVQKESLRRQRDRDIELNKDKLETETRSVQAVYKIFSIVLPPIPPLILAFVVFLVRRSREQEGVSRGRLR